MYFKTAYFEIAKDRGCIYLPIDVGYNERNMLNENLYKIENSLQRNLQILIDKKRFQATIQVLGCCYNKDDEYGYDSARPAKLPRPTTIQQWERLEGSRKNFLSDIGKIVTCSLQEDDPEHIIMLPKNLTPEIIEAMLPEELKRYVWEACYFIHAIINKWSHWQDNENGDVQLKFEYLKKLIPWRILKRLRDVLVEIGIVTSDRYYQKGKKSIGYWLAEQYDIRDAGWTGHVVKNAKLNKRLRAFREGQYDRDCEILVYLNEWLKQLDVKLIPCLEALGRIPNYLQNEMTIRTIFDRQYEFKQDSFGRIHTNLTRLIKDARPYLSINGKPLVNIDIKNSQPLFLCKVLIDKSIERDETTSRFINLCEDGKIYEYLMEKYGRIRNRNRFKRFFFKYILFGPLRYEDRNCNKQKASVKRYMEISTIFGNEFPVVWNLICKIKRKKYQLLSHLMQQKESNFVINNVCTRIMNERLGIPLLTIHDRIMTHAEHADYVKKIIIEEMRDAGFNVSVEIT